MNEPMISKERFIEIVGHLELSSSAVTKMVDLDFFNERAVSDLGQSIDTTIECLEILLGLRDGKKRDLRDTFLSYFFYEIIEPGFKNCSEEDKTVEIEDEDGNVVRTYHIHDVGELYDMLVEESQYEQNAEN